LYHKPAESMLGYTMALLANPSSPNEVQGTNGDTYENEFASVISNNPKIVVQDITNICTTDLTWSGDTWELEGTILNKDIVSFGPELNVGGKYIYGASQGGWRPKSEGMYRITMYLPESDISLTEAVVGNYTDWSATETTSEEEEEVRAATPVVDQANNLTYVDVVAGGERGGEKPGEADAVTDDPCAVIDDDPATTTDPVATSTNPEVSDGSTSSSSSGGGSSSTRRPLAKALPAVLGASTSYFVSQNDIDAQKLLLNMRMKEVQVEHLRLLQLMLVNLLQQMVKNLQS